VFEISVRMIKVDRDRLYHMDSEIDNKLLLDIILGSNRFIERD
jgi:hypothetical protein